MPTDLAQVLIGQWRDSPRMRAITSDVIAADRDAALAALAALAVMSHIDTARGVWLDLLALRLGLRRPATTDPAQDDRFGFDDAGEPFDSAPFSGDVANAQLFPLADEPFRAMIRARAVTVAADGSLADYRAAVGMIDPSAVVQDHRDMTVRVVGDTRMLRLADEAGALPRPAGVAVTYADTGRFGFDAAGVGFDLGPFAGEGV